MVAASYALGKRRSEQSRPQKIQGVVEAIAFALVTVMMIFFFVYVRALNDLAHRHHSHPFPLQLGGKHSDHQPSAKEVEMAWKPAPAQVGVVAEILILSTHLGDIRIRLREDWSQSSVAAGECQRCTFYRAEEKGILQGIIKSPDSDNNKLQVTKGYCPPDQKDSKWKNNCHGPIMEHGMVGWAGGATGPDFFIDWYQKPAKFWGAQHTVWGQVLLEESAPIMDKIWQLPTTKKGLTYWSNQSNSKWRLLQKNKRNLFPTAYPSTHQGILLQHDNIPCHKLTGAKITQSYIRISLMLQILFTGVTL